MPTEPTEEPARKDEREFCGRFEVHLNRLKDAGRCEWTSQVRMLHWRHARDEVRAIVRIDYVVRLDMGPLIGIEAKVIPQKAADLGRYLKQCSDYADSVVAGHARTPQAWVGKPLRHVFLAIDPSGSTDFVGQHYSTATRLMGPFNVGFIRRRSDGLQFYITDEMNWWCEAWGYSQRAKTTNINRRIGNGSFRIEHEDAMPAGAL